LDYSGCDVPCRRILADECLSVPIGESACLDETPGGGANGIELVVGHAVMGQGVVAVRVLLIVQSECDRDGRKDVCIRRVKGKCGGVRPCTLSKGEVTQTKLHGPSPPGSGRGILAHAEKEEKCEDDEI
jgi:hypothetical protein